MQGTLTVRTLNSMAERLAHSSTNNRCPIIRQFQTMKLSANLQAMSGEPIESFTIIVTQGNEVLKPIHDRMPVILHPDIWGPWLESKDTTIPMALLNSFPAVMMTAHPVSKRVNSLKNDDADVIVPLNAA